MVPVFWRSKRTNVGNAFRKFTSLAEHRRLGEELEIVVVVDICATSIKAQTSGCILEHGLQLEHTGVRDKR